VSKPVLNLYLLMLSEIEPKYSFCHLIIPDEKFIEKMIPCPAFKVYMETLLKDLHPESLYKATWKHKYKDEMAFVQKTSLISQKWKNENVGLLVEKKEDNEEENKENDKKEP
jgi:hypothetical protein